MSVQPEDRASSPDAILGLDQRIQMPTSEPDRGLENDDDSSQSSESDWSLSETSLPSRSPTPPSPSLLRQIPYAILHPPRPLDASFRWDCPVDQCRYSVDFLNPTEEEYALMPTDGKAVFSGKWNVKDEWVKQWLKRIVAVHYKSHLDRKGITAIHKGNKVGHVVLSK